MYRLRGGGGGGGGCLRKTGVDRVVVMIVEKPKCKNIMSDPRTQCTAVAHSSCLFTMHTITQPVTSSRRLQQKDWSDIAALKHFATDHAGREHVKHAS